MDLAAYEALTGNHPFDARDNWRVLCPLHSENTPSFFIHKETYLCHCFGCGAKGYLDNILAKAYETSARNVRLALDIPVSSRLHTEIYTPKPEPEFSPAWLHGYPQIVNHPYLERRGFTDETVIEHEVRWDGVYSRLIFPYYAGGDVPVGAMARNLTPGKPKWETLWNFPKSSTCIR